MPSHQTRRGSTSTRSRPGGRGVAARASHSRWCVGARSSQRPSAGPRTSTPSGRPKACDEVGRGRARHRSQRGGRREAERLPPRQLVRGQAPGVGEQRGLEHLVVRQPRSGPGCGPPPRPIADQPGGPDQQGERLLGGPVAGRQQLAVEVEEGHDVGRPRPGGAPPRCRRRPGASGSACPAVAAVTSTTSVPAAAASSSRSRVTPGRIVRNRPAPHCWHTTGRSVPQRRQRSTSLVGLGDGGLAHLAAGDRAAGRAGQQPGPARGVEHAHDPRAARGGGASSGDDSSEVVVHGASRPRSTTSTIGQPARSSARDTVNSRPQPRASSVGAGETSTQGTPARRARSTTTSRACQVGARSSWRASSCSSSTTTAARPATGAHAAARAPITTSAPAAAEAQSRGMEGDGQPGPPQPGREQPGLVDRRRDHERGAARGGGQHGARSGRPSAGAAARPARRRRPAPSAASGSSGCGHAGDRRRRGRQRRPPRPGGDAVDRNARTGPAHRQAAHCGQVDARPAAGPQPVTLAIGFRATPAGGLAAQRRRPSRRPAGRAAATRTIVPTRTRSASASGTR